MFFDSETMGFGGGWIFERTEQGNAYVCPIGTVEINVVRSMNTKGLCRIDCCTLFTDSHQRLFEDEQMAYALDYMSEDDLVADVLRRYGIKEEQIVLIEPEY